MTILISVSANAAAPLLTDQNPQKRQQAIINAANGETTNSEIRELERLAMDNTDLTARSLAIQALGQHEHSFELLKSILENQSESMVARQSAASALGMFNQPRALNALADVYETSDGELKEHIGGCLDSMRARFPASVESVLEGEQP